MVEKKKDYWEGKKTIRVDGELHNKLKVLASQSSKKLGDYIEELINKTLEEKGEKKDGSN
jgi:predicted HicB family RNase H-like nuclease